MVTFMNYFSMETSTPSAGFEYLDHTADVWVHAWGESLEAVYEQTALALMDTMIASKNIAPSSEKTIYIRERSKGALLISFLSEFLYLFDMEEWIFSQIRVESIRKLNEEDYELKAFTYGESFDLTKHEPDTEVKAITYSYLEIVKTETGFSIKIVFDI